MQQPIQKKQTRFFMNILTSTNIRASLVCLFCYWYFCLKQSDRLKKIQENWWIKVLELVFGSREHDIGLENHFSKNRKSKDYVPTSLHVQPGNFSVILIKWEHCTLWFIINILIWKFGNWVFQEHSLIWSTRQPNSHSAAAQRMPAEQELVNWCLLCWVHSRAFLL